MGRTEHVAGGQGDIGPGSVPARELLDHVQRLVAQVAGLPVHERAKRPAAVSVYRNVLRAVYVATLQRLARKYRIGLSGGLYAGRLAASASQLTPGDRQSAELIEAAAALAAAVDDGEGEAGAALLQLFEPLIALQPRWRNGGLVLLERTRSRRRNAGVYYTPEWIVQLLLDWTLDRRLAAARGKRSPLPVVYDPACGSGRFLVAALDRLLDASQHSGRGETCTEVTGGKAVTALGCALGRDIDPLAADLCAATLAGQHLARKRGLPQAPAVATGDSLLAARLPVGGARTGAGRTLVVVGNPPFINAIGRRTPAGLLSKYRQRYSDVRGAADTAAFFLAHAAERAGPGGAVGLVLPRAILNSPSAEVLRGNLPHGLRPELIWAPEEPYAFAGAAVFFCVVVLGPARHCRFSTDPGAAAASFASGKIESANWWSELCRTRYSYPETAPGPSTRLGDAFEVRAGLTASEAYELRPHIDDSRDGAGAKLLTTGLIDPGTSLWGARRCRFLKADYLHPRVADSARDNPRLARRLARAERPKIIVAGLARRLECYLDLEGEYLAAVSTLVITHPRDDVAQLRSLQQELSAPRSAELVYRELGAHALGGGNITIRKSFLLDYPLQDSAGNWK
jgi:hypothetical protein